MNVAASQTTPQHSETSKRRIASGMSNPRAFGINRMSPYEETLIKQSASPGTQFVQHVSLPKAMPDESTYMYSAVHPGEWENNEVSDVERPTRKIMPGYLYAGNEENQMDLTVADDRNMYEKAVVMSPLPGQKPMYYTSDMMEAGDDVGNKSDYFGEASSFVERDTSYSAPSSSRPGLGKFFGLTGTTSQNIQVI